MFSLSLNPDMQKAPFPTDQKQTLGLPDEVLLIMLSFLPTKDLSNTCLVCRDWKNLSIEAGRIYYRNVTITLAGKMIVVKSGLKDLRSYALLFQKRATVSKGADNPEKWEALTSIATNFVKMGDVNNARETLHLITDEIQKSKSLFTILRDLVQLPDGKAALEIGRTMPDDLSKASALSFISKDLAEKKRLDLALEIANEALQSIQTGAEQNPHMGQTLQNVSEAFLTISEQFAKIRKIDRALSTNLTALDVARSISDKSTLARALLSISRSIAADGALLIANEALDAANLIVDGPSSPKSSIFLSICRQFTYLSEVEKAQALADTIPSLRDRSRALLDISMAHARLGNLESALSTAQSVLPLIDEERNPSQLDSIRFLTSDTFSHISKKLNGKGAIDRAHETATIANDLANKIRNLELKRKALSNISIHK